MTRFVNALLICFNYGAPYSRVNTPDPRIVWIVRSPDRPLQNWTILTQDKPEPEPELDECTLYTVLSPIIRDEPDDLRSGDPVVITQD